MIESSSRFHRWLLALLLFGTLGCAVAVPVSALLRGVISVGAVSIGRGHWRQQPLLVLRGPVVIDGTTAGPVVVVAGDVVLNGQAEDDVIALPGDVSIGPNAVAHGNVVSVAGRIATAPTADLSGSVVGSRRHPPAPQIVPHDRSLLFVVQRLRLAGLAVAALLLLGLGVWTVLPWPALVTTATARRYRLRSALLGVGAIVWAPLIVAPLAVSIAGLPIAVLLALALGALWLIGVVSSAVRLGHRLLNFGRLPHSTLSATMTGLVCLGLLPAVPVLGALALLLAGCIGLGAGLVALWDRESAGELAVTQALAVLKFPE